MISDRRAEAVLFLVAFATLFALFSAGFLEPFEVKNLDRVFRSRGERSTPQDIVLLGITDECLDRFGKWPWPRHVHIDALRKIRAGAPKAIGLDLVFAEPATDPTDDEGLADEIRAAGNVILPTVIETVFSQDEVGRLVSTKRLSRPIEVLESAARGTGYINVNYEDLNLDGIARALPLSTEIAGTRETAFALAIANTAFGTARPRSDRPVWVSYLGGVGSFETIPIYKIITGEFPAAQLRDKVVIIGPVATALGDLHHTPFGTIPGPEIHANLVLGARNGTFVSRMRVSEYAFLLLVLTVGLFVIARALHAGAALLTGLLLLFVYDQAIHFAFARASLYVDLLPLVGVAVLAALLTSFYRLFLRLYLANRDLSRRVAELGALYEVAKTISDIAEMPKILKRILDATIAILDCERGSIMLPIETNDGSERLQVEVSTREMRPDVPPLVLDAGVGVAGKAFAERRTLFCPTGSEDPNYFRNGDRPGSTRNLVSTPLVIGDRATGVLNVANRRGNKPYNADELALLETLARHAASVIENARLYKLATVDGLTQLYVRRYFGNRLKEEFFRGIRYQKPLSLIMTDIDHFKRFNDTYGHQLGDLVLATVARIVRETVRGSDFPARYGGEEFIVLCPETDRAGALNLGERLRKRVEAEGVESIKGRLSVTISVGVAYNPGSTACSPEEFVEFTDRALYLAKSGGRNQTVVFEPALKAPGEGSAEEPAPATAGRREGEDAGGNPAGSPGAET